MGKLTLEEAMDKLANTVINMTRGRSLEDSLAYFDYLHGGRYDKDVEEYIKNKIKEAKK